MTEKEYSDLTELERLRCALAVLSPNGVGIGYGTLTNPEAMLIVRSIRRAIGKLEASIPECEESDD